MIFSPTMARLILRGGKTQDRRLISPGASTCIWKPEHTYPIRAATADEPFEARLLVTEVRKTTLGEATFKDVLAEGFSTTPDFAYHWLTARRKSTPARDDISDNEVVSRFHALLGHRLVWAITFKLEYDTPQYLSPASRPRGNDHGYTTSFHQAIKDEQPCTPVDPASLRPEWKTAADGRHVDARAHRGEVLDGMPLVRRLALVQQQARSAGVDASKDLRVIERRLADLERKIGTRAA